MDKDEDALKKRAEEKFFVKDEFKPRELYDLVEKASNFVTINEKGDVFIKLPKCTGLEKVQLVLTARFLGNKLRAEINPELTPEEVSKYAELEPKVAIARLVDSVKLAFAVRVDRGTYRAFSLAKVREFINKLEETYMKKEGGKKDDI